MWDIQVRERRGKGHDEGGVEERRESVRSSPRHEAAFRKKDQRSSDKARVILHLRLMCVYKAIGAMVASQQQPTHSRAHRPAHRPLQRGPRISISTHRATTPSTDYTCIRNLAPCCCTISIFENCFDYECSQDFSTTMSELRNFDRMFRLDGKVALVTGGIAPSIQCDLCCTDIARRRIKRSWSPFRNRIPSCWRKEGLYLRSKERRSSGH